MLHKAGTIYHFRGIPSSDKEKPWFVPPGDYRLLGLGQEVHSRALRVVYEGVGGPDDGQIFMCGTDEWERLFESAAERIEP